MPIQVTMPALSPTMTEGKLAHWLKAEGDAVARGDVLAEIETDKATMEVEAVDAGTLGRIVVPEGSEGVPVNSVIAMILEEGEDAAALEAAVPPPLSPAPAPVVPPSAARAAPEPASAPQPSPQPPATAAPKANGRQLASPLARRLAKERNLDLGAVAGSGPGGRIVLRDIEAAPTDAAPASARTPAPPAAPPAPAGTEAVPHTSVRKIIARRLTEAWQTIPHIYLRVDCEIDALLDLRRRLNERGRGSYKLSVNDFLIRAAAFALRRVPELNVHWSEQTSLRLSTVDIAVAVALDGGLVTPIVRDADKKGLSEISSDVKELAARGKAGKLMPEEYQGGSFTISNLGMFGVKEFGAIINPPQAAILAVGAGEERAVVHGGEVTRATVLTVTLSCDHRVVDGADGARFLQALKCFLEEPASMML